MPSPYSSHGFTFTLGAAALGLGTIANADTATDTSAWTCSQCPFLVGFATQSEAGVVVAGGANAAFGRYTGIDHVGPYLDASGSGQARGADGTYADYGLERLGLASRQGYVDGGREGRYDLRVSYDGQPTRLYDTGATPYEANGTNLVLPSGWVPAGSTAGMSALGASSRPLKLESDRRTVALLARYFATPEWTLFGEFRRQQQDGLGLTSGSFLTEAVQLPQPFDTVTNSLEAGAAWSGRRAGVRLTYTGSWFSDEDDSITFANPYLPIVPGSIQGQLSVPPSNHLQQFAAAGNFLLPWWTTTLTYAASLGTLRQNDSFLPVSTLGPASPLPATSLNGDVHLSHYALGLASHPWRLLSLRGNAAYDGRDDKTPTLAIPYVVTDTFAGGTALTPRYSEDRVRLDGGADYSLAKWLRIGVGGKFNDNHYGPGQVYTNTQETQSWGRATLTPLESLSFTVKIGNGLRKVSSFDLAAVPIEENPLVRDYNYAPRDRVFSSLTGSWIATATLTVTVEGFLAKDDYRSSPLGLQSDHEQRASTTLTWTPRDSLSAYADAGYQRLFTLQNGSSGTATTPWLSAQTDRFWNLSIGGRWVPQERWTLSLDYLLAPSYSDTDTTVGALAQAFPQNSTKLDSTRLDVLYKWTNALQLHVRYTHEAYHSNDWALDGVGPATLPNYLALGIQPYRYNVNMVAMTVRYQFGGSGAGAKAP